MSEISLPRSQRLRGTSSRAASRIGRRRAGLVGAGLAALLLAGGTFMVGSSRVGELPGTGLRSAADADRPVSVRVVRMRNDEPPPAPVRADTRPAPPAEAPPAGKGELAAIPVSTSSLVPETNLSASREVSVQPPPRPAIDAPSPAFVGTWASHAKGCLAGKAGDLLKIRIDRDSARAGRAACRFGRTDGDGDRWNIAASCSDGAERWTANVQLTLAGDRLTWSSERGTQTYLRCAPATLARAP